MIGEKVGWIVLSTGILMELITFMLHKFFIKKGFKNLINNEEFFLVRGYAGGLGVIAFSILYLFLT